MTGKERVAWACNVFNRERFRGMDSWEPFLIRLDDDQAEPVFNAWPKKLRMAMYGFDAIAIALALDERARRRLPEREQAEWAAGELNRKGWRGGGWDIDLGGRIGRWEDGGRDYVDTFDALAIAEAYIRDEMLPDGPGEGGG